MDWASFSVAGALSGTARADGFLISPGSGRDICAASFWAAARSAASFRGQPLGGDAHVAFQRDRGETLAIGGLHATLPIARQLSTATGGGIGAVGLRDLYNLDCFRSDRMVGANDEFRTVVTVLAQEPAVGIGARSEKPPVRGQFVTFRCGGCGWGEATSGEA